MNNQDPMNQLVNFYQSLDSIPTPTLDIRPASRWRLWTLAAISPLGAAIVTYGFISFCATGFATPKPSLRPLLGIDRYALEEIKSLAPAKSPRAHTLGRIPARKVV